MAQTVPSQTISPPGATPTPGVPTGTPGSTNGTTNDTLCSLSEYTPVTVQLQQIKSSFRGGTVTVLGTLSIIDGCTFEVSGFTYSFAATNTYWFGSNFTDPNAEAILVSPTPVGQFQSAPSIKFKLTSTVTFNDFSVLNLFSIDEKAVFGQAVLRQSPSNPFSTVENSKNHSNRLSFDPTIIMTKIFVGFLISFIWIM
ncbi:18966_t:CDS:2 [Funneliformis geosporum]|uniref:733_t:CDS:1 n=1 Tax=Funneliformis geosporum TaxID=1117311 RepID=A0A9W4SQ97_9GLOM|nr:733_t:CDS:2 [Funneliformis geosporum]CAI2177775.1 18966_t:CDS:2 [Funneliformis geosporum]